MSLSATDCYIVHEIYNGENAQDQFEYELEQALEAGEGKLTFTLSEGLYQNVRIVCDDWADYTGEENILYDHTFTNVSVSKNVLSLFWANKPLRWGTIGGVGGLGAVGLLLALLKKRKKKETAVKKA